jgi:hypothetical protein
MLAAALLNGGELPETEALLAHAQATLDRANDHRSYARAAAAMAGPGDVREGRQTPVG